MPKPNRGAVASPAAPDHAVAVPTLPQVGFLRQAQVLQFVPISKSTLWRRVPDAETPRQHQRFRLVKNASRVEHEGALAA